MLAFLNSFLGNSGTATVADRPLWHDLDGKSPVTLGQLQLEVATLRRKLEKSTASSWLLYSENPHYFLLGFLVLLGLQRRIIISASKKPEWLQSLGSEFDAILSDESIILADESTHSDKQDSGNHVARRKLLMDFELPLAASTLWQPAFTGQEAIVFFTSGSTGQPKAVNKNLAALTNEISTLTRTFSPLIDDSLFCASVSHLHIYGLLFRLLLPLAAGGSSVLQQIEYPEQLQNLTRTGKNAGRDQKRVFISSPALLSRLDLNLPPVAMAAIFSSGGPLSFAAAQDTRQYFARLPIEVYGSTETGGVGYRQQTEAHTSWTRFPGLLLTNSENGVVLVSPHLPDLSPCLLDDNLELLADDQFLMKGRKDRVVKISEKRISLTEMETWLETQATVAQCVALPVSLKREIIACAIVLTAEGRQFIDEHGRLSLITAWKKAMRKRFDNVAIPRKWQILTEIPLNSQSKIDTARLLAGFMADAN